MASIYLDEDNGRTMARLLRTHGHDVIWGKEYQTPGTTDELHLISAVLTGRIFVTHNERDFVLLHRAWVAWPRALNIPWPVHRGILVIPQPPTLPIVQAATQVDAFLRAGPSLANAYYIWKRDRGWIPET
ncbi:MAG: DUF5615 family PIN-like protein [Thermomicrobiales bacterium]